MCVAICHSTQHNLLTNNHNIWFDSKADSMLPIPYVSWWGSHLSWLLASAACKHITLEWDSVINIIHLYLMASASVFTTSYSIVPTSFEAHASGGLSTLAWSDTDMYCQLMSVTRLRHLETAPLIWLNDDVFWAPTNAVKPSATYFTTVEEIILFLSNNNIHFCNNTT